jgi:hypothetical protein
MVVVAEADTKRLAVVVGHSMFAVSTIESPLVLVEIQTRTSASASLLGS